MVQPRRKSMQTTQGLARKSMPAARLRKRKKTVQAVDVQRAKALKRENGILRREIKKIKYQFNIIRRASLRLTTELSLEQILDDLVATTAVFFETDAVACMVVDESQGMLVPRAGFGFKTDYIQKQRIPLATVREVFKPEVEYFFAENLLETPHGNVELIRREGLVSCLSLILHVGKSMVGTINLYSRQASRSFSEEEVSNARIFAQQANIAIRNARLYQELREEAQIAKTLLQVAEDVGTLDSLDEVLNRIVIIVTRALDFKMCVIFLWDREHKIFKPAKAAGLPPHRSPLFETLVLRRSEMEFTLEELRQRKVISLGGPAKRFPMEKFANVIEERDMHIVPLVTKGNLLGAMVAAGYRGEDAFNERDEMFIRGIAAQAAIAIDDANLFEDLERAFWDIIKSLAAAIEVKDRYTHSHSESVILYGSAIARALDFSEKELNLICKACLLHDVGKIGIEDQILRKVTPLTPEERKAIEQHPVIGAEILGSARSLSEVSRIVRHHHEHYDGNGYPDKLKGEEIPLYSRILQIADSFDAMTSDRPYRKALSRETAIEQLKIHSGKQFDPQLVTVFLKVLDQQGLNWGSAKEHYPFY